MSDKLHFSFLAPLVLLLSSCGNNPFDVDVSNIKTAPVSIQRFDRDFFALTPENISSALPELQKKYPGFTELFLRNILCPSGIQDSSCAPEIIRFVSDADMHGAYDECQKVFPDLSDIELQLTDVFAHHKYYFPEKNVPQVVAMMSGFNYAIESSAPAIGLEMYLGSGQKYYEMMRIPGYKRFTMRKEFIVTDLVRAWMMKEYPNNTKRKTLLGEMIYQGKLLYLADALMPGVHDTLKIGFTKKQLEWCNANEANVWGHLIANKFLYSSEADVVAKFTGEGPFTTGFVNESPARTGVWIGWIIVRKYMAKFPETKLEQLMNEEDAQMILSKSQYKP